ncbi:PREDICTED: uncharacterized protein LOC105364848 [Ceratosolen solmsi marchali]|uniref:Uncharacterized protein LOC105364848 n=1 Tax=Ceratosolen solmsi marchali TaxID=326594 RepID=A0AAJ7DYL5_9HYME|nr:PREDICTED: uncharacterized protein LOC105364848 [Ceratosolen solmsi marchali]
MSNLGADKWRPMAISNPSTRLRVARSMPHWVMVQNQVDQQLMKSGSRPPTPPKIPPPSLAGDCGDPDYEVIEFPPRSSNQPPAPASNKNVKISDNNRIKNSSIIARMTNGRSGHPKCCLCGIECVVVRCDGCSDIFCESCDEANHRHPKRRGHARHRFHGEVGLQQVKPPLPPKGDHGNPPPIPPPRRNRRSNQVGCDIL